MKGIILAGGAGTRLYPLTLATSKQLLPVYDKPMIYYPLSTLMLAGIRQIMIITTPQDEANFRRLLGDGESLGLELTFATQPSPEGLPQAFLIGAEHIGEDQVTLILGDNLFSGNDIGARIGEARGRPGGTIFGYWMSDPRAYGVVEVNPEGEVLSIEEKPEEPKSNWASPGLYVFDHRVVDFSRSLRPSRRGELEMIDLHRKYLELGELRVTLLPRASTWLDMGTPATLADAGEYVKALQQRQGLLLGSPDEIAYQNGWITSEQVHRTAVDMGGSPYASSLRAFLFNTRGGQPTI